jgi:phosphotransferase system IIB component
MTKITLNIHQHKPIEACYTQLSCFYKDLISLHLTLPRLLTFLLHFRRRRNYTLSPTLLLTCMTKITLNIHHHKPIEACYTQLSCFYKELISLHLTLPTLLWFLLHFRRRCYYTLSPTLLLTCMTKITLNIHQHKPIEACYTQLSCFYKELISLHLTLPTLLWFLLHFRRRCYYTLSPTLLLTCMTKITLNIHQHKPIEACYTQLSCFYKDLISLHLTLPRLLTFLLHFRTP